jgi:hypothetical protein
VKNQGVFKLAVFGVLAGMMLSIIAGCSGGGDGNRNGNGDGNGNGNGGATALSMIKKVPASATSFDVVNYGSFRVDDDLRGAYSQADAEYNDDLAELGIRPVDVNFMTIAARCLSPDGWSGLVILEGTFNLRDLRARFEDSDYYEDEYKGIQTWTSPLHHPVALVSASCIVYGEHMDVVVGCLDVIKSEADSLYDNEDLRDVVAKLPAGVLVSGELGDKVIGASVVKEDAVTLRLTALYLCEDETAAAALKSWWETASAADPDSFENLELGRNGKYLTVACDAAIEDFNWPGNA